MQQDICDVISLYKHGSFNKWKQNFNKKNSPDINSVQQMVYCHKMSVTDQLKRVQNC